jgi:hypothetical protein
MFYIISQGPPPTSIPKKKGKLRSENRLETTLERLMRFDTLKMMQLQLHQRANFNRANAKKMLEESKVVLAQSSTLTPPFVWKSLNGIPIETIVNTQNPLLRLLGPRSAPRAIKEDADAERTGCGTCCFICCGNCGTRAGDRKREREKEREHEPQECGVCVQSVRQRGRREREGETDRLTPSQAMCCCLRQELLQGLLSLIQKLLLQVSESQRERERHLATRACTKSQAGGCR